MSCILLPSASTSAVLFAFFEVGWSILGFVRLPDELPSARFRTTACSGATDVFPPWRRVDLLTVSAGGVSSLGRFFPARFPPFGEPGLGDSDGVDGGGDGADVMEG